MTEFQRIGITNFRVWGSLITATSKKEQKMVARPTRIAFAGDYGDPAVAAKRAMLSRHLPKAEGPPLSPQDAKRLAGLKYAGMHYGETGQEKNIFA